MFIATDYEKQMGIDPATMQEAWMEKIKEVFEEATLEVPSNTFMHTGGKQGVHTEHLGYLLAELQYMQRAYPGATW